MPKVHKQSQEVQEEVIVAANKPKKLKKIKKVSQAVVPVEEEPVAEIAPKAKPKKVKAAKATQPEKVEKHTGSCDVFVSGIPYEANEDTLRDIFGECGQIEYLCD